MCTKLRDVNSQSLSQQPSLWSLLPSPSLAAQYITSRQQLLAPPTKPGELQEKLSLGLHSKSQRKS
jgi:hypothetical protein